VFVCPFVFVRVLNRFFHIVTINVDSWYAHKR
jgi:hypothetical protein